MGVSTIGECECGCHTSKNVIHARACCAGICPICKKHIKYSLEKHEVSCRIKLNKIRKLKGAKNALYLFNNSHKY